LITRKAGERVFEALFILGLGVIWGLRFWWPGLLIDFGAAYGITLALRGRYWPAAAYIVLFGVVPAFYVFPPVLSASIPFVIAGLGAAGLYRALHREPW
jgi:hypothetical protein